MKPSLPSSSAFSIGFSSFGFRTYIADIKENSTLIYLDRSIRWQKEEANRNLLSIHLKITLLLLLLTPFDFLLLCLLCLCLLRHCSLCVRPVIIPELIANDVTPLIILQYPAKDQ